MCADVPVHEITCAFAALDALVEVGAQGRVPEKTLAFEDEGSKLGPVSRGILHQRALRMRW
jgi:hypothetical protein